MMTLPDGIQIVQSFVQDRFHWSDYFVFGSVLIASMAVPVINNFMNRKNTSERNELFNMPKCNSVFLVSFSMVGSFVSGITLLGNPAEVYLYGQQYTMSVLAFIPMTALLSYFYVPVYFELQLKSAYEYFELRFNRRVRVLCSIFGMTHLIIYTPITVLGPTLAIDHVAGFDYRISAASIFLVCIVNSSWDAGLSAVLWTNTLQTGIMFSALIALVICSFIELDGLSIAWERSVATGRTEITNTDMDPRTRHTLWTATIGGTILWLPIFGATQAQIQHYNYLPTLAKSRQCLLNNMVCMMLLILLCSIMGLLMYSKYSHCDPLTAGVVDAIEELLPRFVVDVFAHYPILPAMLVAGITCGSLTTVSSAMSSLAVLLTEDFLKFYRPHWNQVDLNNSGKIISACTGMIGLGLVFIINILNDSMEISPFSTLVHGSLLGPILGAFTLGMISPWANTLGTILGMTASITLSGFIGVGNIVIERMKLLPNMQLPVSVGGCNCTNISLPFDVEPCADFIASETLLEFDYSKHWKEKDVSIFVRILSTSYIWQPGIGALSTLIFGVVFSLIVIATSKTRQGKVPLRLLSRPAVILWEKVMGMERMKKWIEYDPEEDKDFRYKAQIDICHFGDKKNEWLSTKL